MAVLVSSSSRKVETETESFRDVGHHAGIFDTEGNSLNALISRDLAVMRQRTEPKYAVDRSFYLLGE